MVARNRSMICAVHHTRYPIESLVAMVSGCDFDHNQEPVVGRFSMTKIYDGLFIVDNDSTVLELDIPRCFLSEDDLKCLLDHFDERALGYLNYYLITFDEEGANVFLRAIEEMVTRERWYASKDEDRIESYQSVTNFLSQIRLRV